jgi:creatinine amidohydrolase/Fe(II)-dependent formamide hydrolase-like protein
MELCTSKQVAEYLKGNDLAILPVGPLEMHGPLMPLGCDGLIAWGTSLAIAEHWQCLVMPLINYVFAGATGLWPGSVNVSPDSSIAYIKSVARAAVNAGLERTVLVSVHAPLNWMLQVVIRSLYLEHGDVVAAFSPYRIVGEHIEREFGRRGEDIHLLGAMHILGLDGAYRPECHKGFPKDQPGAAKQLARMDFSVPWLYAEDHQHGVISSDLSVDDAPRAAAAIREAAAAMSEAPRLFAQHRQELESIERNEPWNEDDAWSV